MQDEECTPSMMLKVDPSKLKTVSYCIDPVCIDQYEATSPISIRKVSISNTVFGYS